MQPNESQQAIITASGAQPLLITAGAGTGKTETIIQRYSYLTKQHSLKCEHILLLTFTNKAANEMKERLVRNGVILLHEKNSAWVHTFHAFCSRLLKEEAHYLNISPDFEPLSQSEQAMLFQQVYAEFLALDGDFSAFEDAVRHLSLKDIKNLDQKCLGIIEKLRDKVILPDEFLAGCTDGAVDDEKAATIRNIIGALYKRFDTLMAENGYKDFSKLITDVIDLLRKNKTVQEKYRNKFQYVMVDEFQDTNHAQYELLQLLAQPGCTNLTVVGDMRQAIYQWRGADPGNIADFEKSLQQVERKSMTVNYRSCPSIVKYANRFLDGSPYEAMEDLTSFLPKDVSAEPAITLFEHDTNEAEYAAAEIARLLNDGYKLSDIVFLFRSVKNRAKLFEQALSRRGIPFYTSGSNLFFDRDEIHDLIAYFKLIVNPLDKNALIRLLLRPPYSLSDAQLYAIQKQSEKNTCNFFEAVSMSAELTHLSRSILELHSTADSLSLNDLYFSLCERTRFLFGAYDDITERVNVRESLSRFIDLLQKFSAKNQGKELSDFINYFAYAMGDEQDSEELEMLQSSNCVRIMTLHRAKGLEFPCVFLSDITIPEWASLDKGFKTRIATNQSFLFDKAMKQVYFKDTDGYELLKERLVDQQRNESIRLYYVGITRAKERLYITGKKLDVFRAALVSCQDIGWREDHEVPDVPIKKTSIDAVRNEEIMEQARRIKQQIAVPNREAKKAPVVRLSCSTIHEFEKDPYGYYLKHILHVPFVPEQTSSKESDINWRELGTLIHETIEEFHAVSRQTSLINIAKRKPQYELLLKNHFDLINEPLKYYESLEYSSHDSAAFYAEFPFTVRLDSPEIIVELNGQIDRLYVDDTRCKILDFKTGFLGTRDEYHLQMALYALACLTLFSVEKIDAELVFLHQKRTELLSFTKENLVQYKQLIIEYAQKILNNDFSNQSSEHSLYKNTASKSVEYDGVVFHNQESYYRYFYELIIAEQTTAMDTNNQTDIHPLVFKAVVSSGEGDTLGKTRVEFNTETYFLKVRHGDSIRLFNSAGDVVDAELVHVGHHSISVVVRKSMDWNSITGFKEWQDELPFERMKDNLLYFLQHETPLKPSLLSFHPTDPSKEPFTLDSADTILDEYQISAVKNAVLNNDILIVHGPPGTGKTVTIAYMVKELVKNGKRVLLSALTNRAVDAALAKVVELNNEESFVGEDQILRIGRPSMVAPVFHKMAQGEAEMSTHCIAALAQQKKIIFLTAASIRPTLFWDEFDVGIVDEASQMLEPFSLGIANHVKSLILVGDNQQLPPIIADSAAAKNGLQISLFERLKKWCEDRYPAQVIMLKNQYRMNKKLMEFSSETFYHGELRMGSEQVAGSQYGIDICAPTDTPQWIRTALAPSNTLVFVNVKSIENSSEVFTNVACISKLMVNGFAACDADCSDIGIISPFRNEVALLRKSLSYEGLVIDTVDRFQGSDKKVIVLSCAQKEGEIAQLLTDPHRFNVAVTRAKSKMIIVGSLAFASNKNALMEKFITYIQQHGIIIDYE